MRRLIWLCLLGFILGGGIAHAQDWAIGPAPDGFTVTLNERARGYRNTGHIVLADPIYGFKLGDYRFATGGFGRGSAPFGRYTIGLFRGLDDDPNGIGPRWMLRGPRAKEDGDSWDPRLDDMRTYIELHMAKRSSGTMGCIAILGGSEVWADFMSNLRYLIDIEGSVGFALEGNTEASGEVIPFENIHYERVHHERRHRKHRRHKRG